MPYDIIPPSGNGFTPNSQYQPNLGGRLPQGLGSILMMLFGGNMWPLSGGNGNQYDAFWQRQHSMQMMQVGRDAVSSYAPIQNLGGLNPDSLLSTLAVSMMSNPNGGLGEILSPLLGGNPVRAQMASFASLQGLGGLGTLSGTSVFQINQANEHFKKYFYNQASKPINQKEARKYRKDIEEAVGRAKTLGITPEQTQAMFDSDNGVAAGSTGFNSLKSADQAITDITSQIGKGNYTQAGLGDIFERAGFDKNSAMQKAVNQSFKDTQEVFGKKLTSGLNSEVTGKLSAVTRGQFGSADDLVAYLKGNGIKLEQDTITKLSKNLADANKESDDKLLQAFNKNTNAADVKSAITGISAVSNLQTMQSITKGVNYNNTLGFSYEDLMGARNEAIRLKLVGGPGTSLNKLSEQFAGSGNAGMPGLMDALRGIYGNDLSGKQQIQNLSGLIGMSRVNLSDPKEQTYIETQLRNLKAGARTMNFDVGELINLNQQGMVFAAQNPNTRFLGGKETIPLLNEALLSIGAMSQSMRPEDVRLLGGTSRLVAKNYQAKLAGAGDEGAQMLGAAYEYFSQSKDKKTAESILNFAKGDNLSSTAINKFINELLDSGKVRQYGLENPLAFSKANNDTKNAFMEVTPKAQVANYFQRLYALGGGVELVNKAQAYLAKSDLTGLLTDRDINQYQEIRKEGQRLAESGLFAEKMRELNPEAKRIYDQGKTARDTNAKTDSLVSRLTGSLNAGIIERTIQSVARGEFGKKGIAALKDVFGGNIDMPALQKLEDTNRIISQMGDAKTTEDLLFNSGLYSEGTASQVAKAANLAVNMGLTPQEAKKIVDENLTAKDLDKIKLHVSNKTQLNAENAQQLIDAATVLNAQPQLLEAASYSKKDIFEQLKKNKMTVVAETALSFALPEKDLAKSMEESLKAAEKDDNLKPFVQGLRKLGSDRDIADTLNKFKSEAGMVEVNGEHQLVGASKKLAESLGLPTKGTESEITAIHKQLEDYTARNPELAASASTYEKFDEAKQNILKGAADQSSVVEKLQNILEALGKIDISSISEILTTINQTLAR